MYISQNTKSEGDDLIAAQVFVASTKSHMDVLSSVSRLDTLKAEHAVQALKRGAEPVFARAISRVCDQTLTLLGECASQPKIDSGLMTLHKLVSQYSDGLDEVLNAQQNETTLAKTDQTLESLDPLHQTNIDTMMVSEKADQGPRSATSLARENSKAVVSENVPLSADDLEILSEAYNRAAQTLEPLMVFVKTQARKHALQNITQPIKISRPVIEEAHPSFEVIMPSVINSILADARQLEKNVSVSYLVGDTHIPKAQMDKIETCTKELGRCLVKYSLEAPDARRSRGESLTGQISVTAQADTQGMEIVISCTGTELPTAVKNRIEAGSSAYEIAYLFKDRRSTLSLYVAQSVLESNNKDKTETVSNAMSLPLSREVRPMQELSL